jgi:hypothetical protein
MNASEIRRVASNYDKDYYAMPEGVELWGTATGSVPYHRKWWLLKGDEVIAHLDQGCYEDGQQAGRDRTRWINELMRAGKGL